LPFFFYFVPKRALRVFSSFSFSFLAFQEGCLEGRWLPAIAQELGRSFPSFFLVCTEKGVVVLPPPPLFRSYTYSFFLFFNAESEGRRPVFLPPFSSSEGSALRLIPFFFPRQRQNYRERVSFPISLGSKYEVKSSFLPPFRFGPSWAREVPVQIGNRSYFPFFFSSPRSWSEDPRVEFF